jgi:hypothetical protein
VLFDLFRAPADPDPDDLTGALLPRLTWGVWHAWLLAMLGELRRVHPRAVAVAHGLDRGRDMSGFPLRYTSGALVRNLVFAGELAGDSETDLSADLVALGREAPVAVLPWRTGGQPLAIRATGRRFAGYGWHWAADPWRGGETALVGQPASRPAPTAAGRAVAGALSEPAAPEANMVRPARSNPPAPVPRGGPPRAQGGGPRQRVRRRLEILFQSTPRDPRGPAGIDQWPYIRSFYWNEGIFVPDTPPYVALPRITLRAYLVGDRPAGPLSYEWTVTEPPWPADGPDPGRNRPTASRPDPSAVWLSAPTSLTTEVHARRPGRADLTLRVYAGGRRLPGATTAPLAEATVQLSMPQFFVVRERGTEWDGILTSEFGLAPADKPDLLRHARETLSMLLTGVGNIRIVFQLPAVHGGAPGPFNQYVPWWGPSAGARPISNWTEVLIREMDPALAAGGNPPMGITGPGGHVADPHVYDEPILQFFRVFSSMLTSDTTGPDNTAFPIRSLVTNIGRPGARDLLVRILGRCLGANIAHEIGHALLGAPWPDLTLASGAHPGIGAGNRGHNAAQAYPPDEIMDDSGRWLMERTGIIVARGQESRLPDPAVWHEDLDRIVRYGPANRWRIQQNFPTWQ